jgi:tetratricopeptide (TPR) repeat protein
MEIRTSIVLFLCPLALAAAENGTLDGYVFREIDGGPPRRAVTVELIDHGRSRYHETTGRTGGFTFSKVQGGRYRIRARFNEFVITEDFVTVAAPGKNFIALMLPKRWAGLQGFGTVSAGQLAAQSNPKVQRMLRDAARAADRQDWAGAIRIYERAVEAGAHAEVWDALGVLYRHLDRTEEALRAFEEAIRKNPKYLFSYSHLAQAYLEDRRYPELAAVARRALAVDANWLTGHVYLAEAQSALGDLAAAQQSAETASRLAQGRAAAPYLVLAKILWRRRYCAGARQAMQRYLDLSTSARPLPEVRKSVEMLQACKAG